MRGLELLVGELLTYGFSAEGLQELRLGFGDGEHADHDDVDEGVLG